MGVGMHGGTVYVCMNTEYAVYQPSFIILEKFPQGLTPLGLIVEHSNCEGEGHFIGIHRS